MPSNDPAMETIASPAPQRRAFVRHSQSPGHQKAAQSPHFSPGNRRRKDIGDYWLGKTLGKGSSGRVKLGIHKVSGEKVAIKIIPKSHLAANDSVERAVKREIAVMKLIRHPNIIRLLDVIDLADSSNLYLILEYVQGGELFEYLVSQSRLSESEARKYFQQIIFSLDYCHRHLICHRDLKPENLLLDKDKNIKIADFGMASLQPAGSLLETSCGSPHYASPEIVTGVPYNGSASDIWSCGIILYALLCGHLPFDDDNIRELLNKVKVGRYRIPDHISPSARDLIRKILVIHPEKRLTMQQVQQHPWFLAEPPSNPSILPDPPSAAEIGRPVSNESEIDPRLLETLKVLWTDLTTEQVVQALLNDEYNMQKVTYVLLQRHANNNWEANKACHESPAKRKRPATICVMGKDTLPGIDQIMSKIAEREERVSITGSMSPNNTQRHSLQPQQLGHPRQPSRLEPVTTRDSSNVGDVDVPPPVPPKPIVIRADLIYNQALADASANLKSTPPQWPCTPPQQRHPMWHHHHHHQQQPVSSSPSPRRPQTYQAPTPLFQNSPHVSYEPCSQQHPQHCHYNYPPHYANPYSPHQQHMDVAHMLSPRVSSNRVIHSHVTCQGRPHVAPSAPFCQACHHRSQQHLYTRPETAHHHCQHPQPHHPHPAHPLCSPDMRLTDHSTRFNRFMSLWQRSRVEPTVKSPKIASRLWMPSKRGEAS